VSWTDDRALDVLNSGKWFIEVNGTIDTQYTGLNQDLFTVWRLVGSEGDTLELMQGGSQIVLQFTPFEGTPVQNAIGSLLPQRVPGVYRLRYDGANFHQLKSAYSYNDGISRSGQELPVTIYNEFSIAGITWTEIQIGAAVTEFFARMMLQNVIVG
jgi:hypothetical protein